MQRGNVAKHNFSMSHRDTGARMENGIEERDGGRDEVVVVNAADNPAHHLQLQLAAGAAGASRCGSAYKCNFEKSPKTGWQHLTEKSGKALAGTV